MQMHSRGLGAGWSWLMAGLGIFKRDPGAIVGAAILLALCMALPTAIQMLAKPQGTAMLVMLSVIMLASGLVYPILIGGFMRVIDATRNNRVARALMLFEPFRPGQGGIRLVLFGLCLLLVYFAFLALVLTTVGRGMFAWYLQLAAQQAQGGPLHALPPLPAGFSLTLGLLTVFFLFYSGVYAIGICQVALRRQSALAALRDGIAGAFKNVLPLVVLAICGLLLIFVMALVFGVVATILVLLGALVSTTVGLVLAIPVYLAMMVLLCAVMMGVNYAIWHDVADGGQARSTDVPLPSVED